MLTHRVLTGKILLISGLHIGGSDAGVKIGGIDNPVIKNPVTHMPYIPGSSLKGKIRSLLEAYYGLEDEQFNRNTQKSRKTGAPSRPSTKPTRTPDWTSKYNQVAVMFGFLPDSEIRDDLYPTRLVFRDSSIIGAIQSVNESEGVNRNIAELTEKMGSRFVEGKMEVAINRIKGTAQDGALRQIERVPAGTVFDLEIVLRSYLDDDSKHQADGGNDHLTVLLKGLKLLQNDALGGYGSRGSGRVKLFDLKLDNEELDLEKVSL